MGKKTKKLIKMLDSQIPLHGLGKSVEEDMNSQTNSCLTSTNSEKKSKKKNRKRDFSSTSDDTHEQMQRDEGIESNASVDPSTVKKKSKKSKQRIEINEPEASEEDQSNKVNEIELCAPKKKKKKYNLLQQRDTQEIDQDNVEIDYKDTQNTPKKKKNKDIQLNEINSKEDITVKGSADIPKKKKKSRNKAKTGAPVLNDEEAQVTQEDIDKFCDELDEEDNKLYEEWVKLLDTRLSKKSAIKQ